MTTTDTMEPCPFCGGHSTRMTIVPGDFWVCCDDCGADGGICNSVPDAIAAWNRRAACGAALVAELLDALTEVKEWIDNWSPDFTNADEWPATKGKIQAAIAKARAATGKVD